MTTSFSDAVAKAKSVTSWTVGMCDNFVANMYGYSSSGYATAVAHWNSVPDADKHPGDMNAPEGALMFWGGGMGHVAISDGQGGIISTDMPNPGVVSTVPANTPSVKWGKPYLGWTPPYFQGQTGAVGHAAYTVGSGTAAPALFNLGCLWDPVGCAAGNATGFNAKDFGERLGLIAMGTVMILIGLYKMTSGNSGLKLMNSGKGKPAAVETESEGSPE